MGERKERRMVIMANPDLLMEVNYRKGKLETMQEQGRGEYGEVKESMIFYWESSKVGEEGVERHLRREEDQGRALGRDSRLPAVLQEGGVDYT